MILIISKPGVHMLHSTRNMNYGGHHVHLQRELVPELSQMGLVVASLCWGIG